MSSPISLTEHILDQQRLHPDATGEFSTIMTQIVLGGKMIAQDLRQAGLLDILGSTGDVNIQGEEVQRLDQRANDTFVQVFESSKIVRTVISEEMEEPYTVIPAERTGKYAVFFDPLDGSSNIDVNAPLGAIFSKENSLYLKPGVEQVAGGYILFGTSTILVYTCGDGVHQFTLNPGIGEFLLSASNITIPSRGKIYSINEGNYKYWDEGLKKYIKYLQDADNRGVKPYTARYIGSLVSDFHRNLIKGGIYLYPKTIQNKYNPTKLVK